MDSLITAAARALAAGDPLGALKRVALRDDAPALALRGIAMAQLGDLVRAKALLRSAARAFGPKEAVARARCVVAEAEVALVSRDLGWPAKALDAARATLEEHGDRANAAHARYLEVRRLLLIGRIGEAEGTLPKLDPGPFPPALRTAHELVVAGIAMRRLRTKAARAALARAERAARHARIPALAAEVENAFLVLNTPAARLIAGGEERVLLLEEVEALLASKAFVVDACRYVVRDAGKLVSLARRPVLFALARALGEAWPGDVSRDTLVARAFGSKRADESHRARLRVGAMQLAGPQVWGPPRDVDGAIAVLREAVAVGVNHIDTSDFYGPHVTNQIIKQALHPYPDDLVIVIKVGARRGEDKSWVHALSRQELADAVHDNLRNLGLDTLDVVNLRVGGVMGPSEGSIEEPLTVLAELKRQGLIRQLGLSNVSPEQLAEAQTITEIVCVQNLYNLAHRNDDGFINDLAGQRIAYVPFFPLGGFSPLQSSALDAAAASLGATPMQVALAWLLQRSPNVLLIPGTSSVKHLRENLNAAALHLPSEIIADLDSIGGDPGH